MTELFCERLRRLRKARGLTLRVLGERVGVCKNAVVRWEMGDNEPKCDRLYEVARALNVTTDYLLTGREAPQHAALIAAIRRTTTDPRVLALVEGR